MKNFSAVLLSKFDYKRVLTFEGQNGVKSDGNVELRGRVEAAKAFIPAMKEKGTKVPLMQQIQTEPNANLNMDFLHKI